MIDFLLHDLMSDARGVYVCGRCGDTAFGIGDIFNRLSWEHVERDEGTKEYVTLDEGLGAEVMLRVCEIGYYGGTIDTLYPCHTAGIRFTGPGVELLNRMNFERERKAYRWWSLRGD